VEEGRGRVENAERKGDRGIGRERGRKGIGRRKIGKKRERKRRGIWKRKGEICRGKILDGGL
jgi:hypothetical protein